MVDALLANQNQSPWFLLAPIILLLAPAITIAATIVTLELANGKWRYTVRGLLLSMTFIAVALAVLSVRS